MSVFIADQKVIEAFDKKLKQEGTSTLQMRKDVKAEVKNVLNKAITHASKQLLLFSCAYRKR